MGEGFLVQPTRNEEMEEIGDEYFHDLVSRSFFQQSRDDPSCFLMHDLINDLAKFVSGEFCFRLEGSHSCKVTKKTRHLSYTSTEYDAYKKFEGIDEVQVLRTLYALPVGQAYYRRMDNRVVHDLLPILKRLRVLSLSQYCNLARLSNSIGNLKHLQYLNLSGTSIERLPETLCILYNLQTLILDGCEELVELPANIAKLVNLHHLDISGTKLKEMPSQMGKLTKLQTLTDFFLGKQSGSSIKELGELKRLRGFLSFWNLQHVIDAQDALEANLKSKNDLRLLELRWDGDTDDSQHERDVLEHLQPCTNVECLSIVGFGGTRFPDWVGDSSFLNITSLWLNGCKYFSSLPPLGQLASLSSLWIEACDGVEVVGPEFYGTRFMKQPFPSLKCLTFEKMPQWNSWISYVDKDGDGAFPLLQKLYIRKCPNLTMALPSHLPSLTTLEIQGCQQLVASLPKAPSITLMTLTDNSRYVKLDKFPSGLHSLSIDKFHSQGTLLQGMEQMGVSHTLGECIIRNYDSLKCFPLELFPKLEILRIFTCPHLESLRASEEPLENSTLSSLEIFDCPNLVSFPEGRLPTPNLTEFSPGDCSNLKSLPNCMHSILPSLERLEISNCPELESFPEGGLPSKLESLEIDGSIKLIAGRMQWDLKILPSLQRFSFGSCKDVESFPEESLLPSTLTSLEIWNLQNLKYLDYKGLQHLTSLKELKISDCPELQCIPEEGLPSSISSLCIYYCPLLERRCQQELGEDWPKISHIPDIEINLCKIN